MGYYTRPKATFASHANDKIHSRFQLGDRVRIRFGAYAGYEGRILQELTGRYHVALYDAGFGTTTWVSSKGMERL